MAVAAAATNRYRVFIGGDTNAVPRCVARIGARGRLSIWASLHKWCVARIGARFLRAGGVIWPGEGAQSQPGSCGEHFDAARGGRGRRGRLSIWASLH
jgi:hypothetical protein